LLKITNECFKNSSKEQKIPYDKVPEEIYQEISHLIELNPKYSYYHNNED